MRALVMVLVSMLSTVARAQDVPPPAPPAPPAAPVPPTPPAPPAPPAPVVETAAPVAVAPVVAPVPAAPAPAVMIPAPPPPAVLPHEPSVQLRAGLGVARYGESGQGWSWESNFQPFAKVGFEGVLANGRNQILLQGSAGFGLDTHMSSSGALSQENDFHQQIFEVSPRLRHPLSPSAYIEAGYRLTVQRLFFTDIPSVGDAEETVTAHALEVGFGWNRLYADGGRRQIAFGLGVNHGSADNSLIDDDHFSASGLSLDFHTAWRRPSGLQFGVELAWRHENGSSVDVVTFQGMQSQAMWPDNTTLQLLATAGVGL